MKPRVAILNTTCLDVLDQLDRTPLNGVDVVGDADVRRMRLEDADRFLGECDGVVLPAPVRSLPHEPHMRRHGRLKVLAIAASGYDWLDLAAATRHGIVVTNVVGGLASHVVAELAIGLMLDVARQVTWHDRELRAGTDTRGVGVTLFGKTLGIIGLGHVGRAVVPLARALGMKVLATSSHADPAFVREHQVELLPRDQLLRRSDVVSLHTRLAPGQPPIGARELATLKRGAILINTARRELVDEAALAQALESGRLRGAGLDDPPSLMSSPLLRCPNVVFTPHLGNRAAEAMADVLRRALEDAASVLGGQKPASVVNPEVYQSPALRVAHG